MCCPAGTMNTQSLTLWWLVPVRWGIYWTSYDKEYGLSFSQAYAGADISNLGLSWHKLGWAIQRTLMFTETLTNCAKSTICQSFCEHQCSPTAFIYQKLILNFQIYFIARYQKLELWPIHQLLDILHLISFAWVLLLVSLTINTWHKHKIYLIFPEHWNMLTKIYATTFRRLWSSSF